ncbi:MAG: hypothetical protein ACR2JR_11740 [Rubrobacteraceae bacterium]
MTAELWQFGIMLAVFCVVLVLWLKIIYLPRRTMERWEARDPAPNDSAEKSRELRFCRFPGE